MSDWERTFKHEKAGQILRVETKIGTAYKCLSKENE